MMSKDIGYVVIKHLDISDDIRDDDVVIQTERIQFGFGEHILNPKNFEKYENIPFREPIAINPDPCNEEWKEPMSDLQFGQQKINIGSSSRFTLVEFYYVKKGVMD